MTFAGQVPEVQFSPADILLFLRERQKITSDVAANVEQWIGPSTGQREAGRGELSDHAGEVSGQVAKMTQLIGGVGLSSAESDSPPDPQLQDRDREL